MVTSMLRMLGPEMYVQWLSLPRAPRKQRQLDYAKMTSRALSGESYSDTVSCYVLSLMLLLTINCSNFICLSKTDSWSRSSTYQKLNIDLLELESRCSHGSRMPFLVEPGWRTYPTTGNFRLPSWLQTPNWGRPWIENHRGLRVLWLSGWRAMVTSMF